MNKIIMSDQEQKQIIEFCRKEMCVITNCQVGQQLTHNYSHKMGYIIKHYLLHGVCQKDFVINRAAKGLQFHSFSYVKCCLCRFISMFLKVRRIHLIRNDISKSYQKETLYKSKNIDRQITLLSFKCAQTLSTQEN